MKYTFAGSSFLVLLVAMIIFKVEYLQLTKVVYFAIILYGYLLSDIFFSLMVAICVSAVFYMYPGAVGRDRIASSIVGVMLTAICFTLIFWLLERLMYERNRYREMSITDSLTGLANLTYALEKGHHALVDGKDLTMLIIDIDNFRHVNDTYGHLAGNRVLISVAGLLKKLMAGVDCTIGRLGGDEFIILVKDCAQSDSCQYGKKIQDTVESEVFYADPELAPLKLSCSIGHAHTLKSNSVHIEALLHSADMDMYYNKYEKRKADNESGSGRMNLDESFLNILNVIAEKDMYTYVHSQYVAKYAVMLAEALELPADMIAGLHLAGWLHDIGKVLIPNSILRKPAGLNKQEYSVIKHHVIYGLNNLNSHHVPQIARNAIQYHHERWDGTGYPAGVGGENTPIEGRIIQIADVFSAITIKRVYRERMSVEKAIDEMRRNSGTQFDPDLITVFADIAGKKGFSNHISQKQ